MQGQKTVILLGLLLVAVISGGLWFGLHRGGGLGEGETSTVDPRGTGGARPEELPPLPEFLPAGPGTGRLAGRVLLLADSTPVKDVMIRLVGPEEEAEAKKTVTGSEGYFLFREVPAGDSYELSLAHGEFAPMIRPGIAVVNGEVTDVGVLHLERAVAFVVEVTDGGGAPIAGATVEIHPWAGERNRYTVNSWMEYALEAGRVPVPLRSTAAGEDGRAEFDGLPGGHYYIVADAEGYARKGLYRLLSPENEGTTVTVRLGVGFSLSGTVLDRDGSPVEGRILASPASMGWGRDQPLRRAGEIDEDGRYVLTRLSPGALSLSVAPEGSPPVPAGSVQIPRMKTFDIKLGEAGSLTGRVTDPAGEPVAGAEVRAVVAGTRVRGTSGTVAVTDPEGAYRIDGVPPGQLSMLQVIARGYAPYPGPLDQVPSLTLSPGAVLERDVTLRRGARLTGTVRRSRDKAPIPGARVIVTGRSRWGNSPSSATSGPDGTYTFEALSPGEYSLAVLADGYYQARDGGSSSPGMRVPGQDYGARWRVKIVEGAPVTTKDLVLDEGGVVSGVVVTSTGTPVPNTRVYATRGGSGGNSTTGADGTFEVRGLAPAERLSVYAWQPGRVARSDTFPMGPGEKVTGIRLVLQASARISGVVELAEGGHPAGATVTTQATGRGNRGWRGGGGSAPVGADGSFVLEEVPPGNLVVVVNTPGLPRGTSDELTVGEGAEVTGIRILVPRGLTLTGEVTEGEGSPVAGAGITISGGTSRGGFWRQGGPSLVAQTDARGRFTIEGLETSNYRVTAAKEGYTPVSKTGVNPATGDLLRLRFEKAGEITGRVIDEAGAPVSGISIGVVKTSQTGRSSTNFQHRGTTSVDGTFRITGVGEGPWTVSARPAWGSAQPYAANSVEDVSPGDDPIEITVRPGLSITGSVTDPDGAPLAGLNVYVRHSENSRFYKSALTGQDGGFELLGLEPGDYKLTVQSRTPGMATASLDKVTAGSTGVAVRLETALAISGRVVDGTGAPVRSVSVRAQSSSGSSSYSRSGSTRPDGNFSVLGLPPGAYDLTFTAPGRYVAMTLPDVPAGTTAIEVRIDPGLSISGTLRLPGGAVAAGVNIAADRKGTPTIRARSGDDGRFEFRGLEEGKYSITVTRSTGGFTLLKPVVAEAGKKDLKIVLAEGLTIRGMVVSGRGQGMAGAWVGLRSARGGGVRTDESGSFAILGLSPGEYTLQAWGDGRRSPTVKVKAGDQAVQIRIE